MYTPSPAPKPPNRPPRPPTPRKPDAVQPVSEPRAQAIFTEAVALAESAREEFLAKECCGDEGLLGRVRALLAAHSDVTESLDEPKLTPEIEAELARLKPEEEGERIANYKLLQQIGEGGFGSVWMAEQFEPVQRRVALKIIKLGMDTREVIGRFEQERQALAMMDHPNIAKVFDAGATRFGRPFFVMELVKGIPITQYCDEAGLGTRERLALFGDVCSAIQHAHQKGIIHRDIKPSNVMVTLYADQPVVKVIDFGIAKATQSKLTDKTLFTRFEQFIGTPVYMSPEQAALSAVDIDTRSDIYALGILLYELLTGKPPFDAQTLASAGHDEMRRIIREVEPPRPSMRLSTAAGEERTLLAKARRIEPGKLSRLVEPDLDWIVMKAIEKDRTRRYETANGLAADIKRYLADEPVSATPPSAAYQFHKFARRHQAALRVAAGIAAVLVLATTVSTWQAVRATRATKEESQQRVIAEQSQAEAGKKRQEAEAERQRAEDSAETLRKILYTADMKLAQVALEERNRSRALELLSKYADPAVPKSSPAATRDQLSSSDQKDLRGWEWRYLWRQSQGDETAILQGHQNRVDSIAFSPRGNVLLSGSKDRTARLWDVDTHREIHCYTFPNSIAAVAFSPDGKHFAIANGKTVAIGDAETQGPVEPLLSHASNVYALAFSPDGKTLASGSNVVKLWDLAGAREIPASDENLTRVLSLAFSTNSQVLAAGGWSPHLRLWDLAAQRQLPSLKSHTHWILGVAFSPADGTLVSSSRDQTLKFWNPASPEPLASFTGPWFEGWAVAFSSDGKTLATGWGDQTIKLWNMESRQQVATLKGHTKEVVSLAFSPDGRVLASGSKDGTIRLWNPAARPASTGYSKLPDSSGLYLVSSDEKAVLLGQGGQNASLWDPRTATELSRLSLPPGVVAMALHSGSNLLAMVKHGGTLSLWNLATRHERLLQGHASAAENDRNLAFSADGLKVACLATDQTIMLFDVASGKETGSVPATVGEFARLRFSPDCRLLPIHEPDGTTSVWDVSTCKKIATMAGHQEEVAQSAFSPDGKTMATASFDGSLRLWDIATAKQIGPPVTGPFLALFSVAFSPDGKRLVAGTGAGQVVIWDVETLTEVTTLKGHKYDPIRAVSFLDQDTLATMSSKEFFVWHAPKLAEIDVAKSK